MPAFTVSRIADVLNDQQKSLKGAKILGIGVTYKRDVTDTRESPALEVMEALVRKGAIVRYTDPYVPSLDIEGQEFRSLSLTPEVLASMDCVVVLTDHSLFDYEMIAAYSPLILDGRNALKRFSGAHICRL
jgi:UDP-N-acetyl-D-glucosamine dehydrogenase